ncbi:MAG: hypothetical protein OXG84_16255 [Chloroflexi bacterium]|nr:hypothetical protein [Chloroflexota bacterium]
MQSQVQAAILRKSTPNIFKLPVHPWLIGAVPILFLYSQNFGLVIENEVPALVFWMLLVTTIGFVSAYAIWRNACKAALITSSVMVLFSLSGHFHSLLARSEPLIVWTTLVLIATAIVVAELHKIRSERFFEQVTTPLNLVSLALILIQVVALYSRFARPSYSELTIQTGDSPSAIAAPRSKIQDSRERPDIYYIIPDAYSSDIFLQSFMSYDNSKFTEALKARGFEVIPHAQTNYPSTLVSLASTLNMRHFSTNPTELNDFDYLRHSIAYSEVARYLSRLGYTYVQLLSGYLFPSAIADINRDFTPSGPVDVKVDENAMATFLTDSAQNPKTRVDLRNFYHQSLAPLYFETTLIKPIANEIYNLLQRDQLVSYDKYAPERFLDTVAELESIAEMPEATFTLVHLLKPHRPTVFDKHGNVIGRIQFPSARQHLDELEFVNSKFIEMVDIILDGSRHQPIIIFQADHGSRFGALRGSDRRKVYFDVYSAYALPDQYSLDIPRPHTNINTFPLILNSVFDAGFDLQDNRLIELFAGAGNFAAQQDVTDEFARK